MKICDMGDKIIISDYGEFNLGLSLDCGQAFRWRMKPDLSWQGAAFGKEINIREENNTLIIKNSCIDDVKNIWIDYFDLNRDYGKILSAMSADSVLSEAVLRFGCIRILRQEPWEALCSFIISACNNIPRIKGIVERLCENFGEKKDSMYSFPSAKKISLLNQEDLSVLRAGYRIPFILDAARKVSSGEINLESMKSLSVEEAEKELMKINGVGKKVADCTILFGLSKSECFPVDRHIKRITEELYPNGFPAEYRDFAGIAQQYLFCLSLDK